MLNQVQRHEDVYIP